MDGDGLVDARVEEAHVEARALRLQPRGAAARRIECRRMCIIERASFAIHSGHR